MEQQQGDGVGPRSSVASRAVHAAPGAAGTGTAEACHAQGRNIGNTSGKRLCGEGGSALETRSKGSPRILLAARRASAWRRKEGSGSCGWGSRSWHLSSLTSAPPALAGLSWLLAASPWLPVPCPPAGTPSPAWPGSGRQEVGCEEDQLPRAPSPPQQSSWPPPGSPCQARV